MPPRKKTEEAPQVTNPCPQEEQPDPVYGWDVPPDQAEVLPANKEK